MTEEIFLDFSSICLDHVRCLSIIKPNDLASSTFMIWFPSYSILTWSLQWDSIHWRDPIMIINYYHKLCLSIIFRLSRFAFNQQFRLLSSELIAFSIIFSCNTNTCVISEHSWWSYTETIWQVVNIDQEKKWSKDASLGNTTGNVLVKHSTGDHLCNIFYFDLEDMIQTT